MKKITIVAGFITLIGGSGPAKNITYDRNLQDSIELPAMNLEHSVDRLDSSVQKLNHIIKKL